MKLLGKIIIFALLVFNFLGCGGSEHKTKLKVSFGAVTGSANFPGGLFLFAKSDSGKQLIKQVPIADTLELELVNGNWNFAVLGWDGVGSAFSGNSHCDFIQGMQLEGVNFDINLNATQAKCNQFATASSITSQNFAPLKFFSCMNIKAHLDIGENVDSGMDCSGGGDGEGTGPGGDISFKIAMLTKEINGAPIVGLESSCVNGSGSLSTITYPFSSPNLNIPVQVKAFTGASCSGDSSVYTFADGLHNNAISNLAQAVIDPSVSINLYLHVDICSGAQLTSQPFAATYGETNDYHLICTANQFVNMGSVSTSNDTFELGQNIDFSQMTSSSASTFAYVPNDFGGEIRGMFKSVLNGDRALFETIKQHPSDGNYISNFLIDNFNLNFTASSGQSFGIFANNIENFGTQSDHQLEIGNIHILRTSSITVNGATSGYIGAFAGKVNHTNPSGNSYIRRVQSLADVVANNNSNSGQYVGGLVGKVMGVNGSSGGSAYLELNDVGVIDVPYLNNLTDSKQVLITGFNNVGGMVGAAYQASLRGLNNAHSKISTHGKSGGLIGTVFINNSQTRGEVGAATVDVEFVPLSDPSNYIGGIVGNIYQTSSSNNSFIIAASVVDMLIQNNGNEVNYLGGLVGQYNSTGGGDLKLYNSKANVDILVDGSNQGGLVGAYSVGSVQPGFNTSSLPAISYSLAQGNIGNPIPNSTTTGNNKGGLVGLGKDTDIYRSIANIDVYGEEKLGGAIGNATDSVVYETHLKGLIELTSTSSGATFAGGVFGELYNNFNQYLIPVVQSKIDFDINYNNVNIPNCQIGQCGNIVGGLTSSHYSSISFNSIALGSINDTFGSEPYQTCGSKGYSTCPSTINGFTKDDGTQTSESSFACSLLASDPFVTDAGVCVSLFEKRWREYGHSAANVDFEYEAGNQVEPFGLASVLEWDNLSDDSFLMAKSYILKSTIDFGNTAPNPIGTKNNPFSGSINPNGFELKNINFTATLGKTGIISYLGGGASIGNFKESLIVNGLDINCGTQSNCGFIGVLEDNANGGGDAEVNIKVYGGDIVGAGSNDCTGGLIGNAMSSARFNESSFQGAIDVAGIGVGGFIGCVSVSSSGSSFNDLRFDFDESFADLDKIIGDDYVGGFIGEVQNTSSSQSFIKIEESYVVIDKDAIRSGSSLKGIDATSGSFASGLIGGIDLTTNELHIDEVYIDTSTAKVPSFYRPIAKKSAGTLDGSDQFSDIAIIWNSSNPSSAGSFYNTADSVPTGSGIGYDVNSVNDLISAASSSSNSSFEASAGSDDHGDWYYPIGNRVLQLEWQNPLSNNDW